MRVEELRKAIRARPFRPFVIHTADGGAIPIWHPDYALITPDGRTVHTYQKDFATEMLDVMLITRISLENAPQSENVQTNGTA